MISKPVNARMYPGKGKSKSGYYVISGLTYENNGAERRSANLENGMENV